MLAIQEELEFEVPGVPSAPTQNGSQIIAQMIDDQAPLPEIIRRIAKEIALLLVEMTSDCRPRFNQRQVSERVKLFRELERTLVQSEALKNRDVLDFEGGKFRYVFKEILGLFRQALLNIGMEQGLVHNVILQFRDLVSEHEEVMHRELKRMDQERR